MRFRQVHLDFHTSGAIPEIGAKFDKKEWQDTLREAAVNSITCFSSCHHGYSYHPTEVGQMHPHLNFNLLRAQMDASHEIDVKVPIYLTGGSNNLVSELHPQWRSMDKDGRYFGWVKSPFDPGFHKICFNTGYLDYLCDQISEAVTMFPDADGVFIDIITAMECCCPKCIADMLKAGLDPEKQSDRVEFARKVLMEYYRRTTAAARCNNPDMPIYHNGHIIKGDREVMPFFSHFELESLPTGGWGYDHYPLSAAYCRNIDKEFLGMTGKFNTTWGEFGGFKHPNALRYECSAMLAHGSKCSIGDQLHPCGKLDKSTYALIGEAYREVEKKEAWCDNVKSRAAIAILGEEALDNRYQFHSYTGDIGASRVLLELHQPFDYIDGEMDFGRYSMIIMPDYCRIDDKIAGKLQKFIAQGGKLVLSAESGMKKDADVFHFDIGGEFQGKTPYKVDYLCSTPEFSAAYMSTPQVMYRGAMRLLAREGVTSIGDVYDPYFNRTYEHFCSHQHTPFKPEASGFSAGTMQDNILYFAHPVFTLYRAYGSVPLREFIGKVLKKFAGKSWQVESDLPSQGRISIMEQPEFNREIVHLLYANTILRGGKDFDPAGDPIGYPIELIEELNPAPASKLSLLEPRRVKEVMLVPEKTVLPFIQQDDRIQIEVPSFTCHQMIQLSFE